MMIKTLLKKTTGCIRSMLFHKGDVLMEKVIPFDTFIFIINGKAELVNNGVATLLKAGQSIIIPAHTFSSIKALEKLNMLSTVIKSGYEDVSY
jgi:quercetin dioxygenase-like cupin family protein